ncbi:FAD-dependent monooxygenase [Nonomuraea typhae]|uniref:FAD-dependent monooxygenase n=1 Tax=Nonomuraea typhae TaxID=2603600 RepID=UPI0012FC5F7D|nr:FAD-dependent monooxygenase [Nonomuraea typhae]
MKAIIVGGGIGGLAAAAGLHRKGWQVAVLERAAAFTEVGAGLSLQPNAVHALTALGIRLTEGLTDPPQGIRTSGGNWLIRNDGALLSRRYGRWAMVHRATMIDLLRAELPSSSLRPGVAVRAVHPDGRVEHDGGVLTADLVVGADGVRSVTRASIFPEAAPPRYAGYATWRMIAPPQPVDGSVETWGGGARFGYAPLPDGRVYCYAMIKAAEGSGGDLGYLRRIYASWHEPIPSLLASVDPAGVLYHDTYELPDLPSYVAGKVALLGDAAHAMTPNLGQGACQALEDAVVLAGSADLAAYDRLRRPRTQDVVRRSRQIGDLAHMSSAPLTAARNLGLRLLPTFTVARQMDPVLRWAP